MVVDDAGVEARADAAHPPGALPAPALADRAVGLRRSVALDELHAEALAEAVEPRRRRRRGERGPHGVRPVLRAVGTRHEDVDHRPEEVGDRRARGGDLPPEARRGEARAELVGGTGDERLHERVERVRVEEREHRVEDVVLADLEHLADEHAPPVELRVRAADALRRPRGPRRVEDRPGVARADVPGRDRVGRGRQLARRWPSRFAGISAGTPSSAQTCSSSSMPSTWARISTSAVSMARTRAPELRSWCASCSPRRAVFSGTAMAPIQVAAEDEIEQLDAVLAHERDAVAPRDAGRLQQAGRAGGRVARPREGPLDRAHAQERLVAVALRLALEQRGERLLRQRQPAERRPVEGRRSVVVLPIRRADGSRHPVISSRRAGSSRGCSVRSFAGL